MNQSRAFSQLQELIAGSKFENHLFAAGGCVRDLILGRDAKDIDVVVTLPNGGIEFAQWVTEKTGGTATVFPRFGTAKFVWRGFDIEAVIPRAESYTDETRNPDVSFTSLENDALRRDFTVNALYWDITNDRLLDFVGGQKDIANQRIATAIHPELIFDDDPLRMLRAIRFARRFDWAIDDQLFGSIKIWAPQIKRISQERITAELTEILMSRQPGIGLEMLKESGLLPYILPEVDEMIGVEQNRYHFGDVWIHTLEVMRQVYLLGGDSLEHRLAALFHDVGKKRASVVTEKGITFPKHEEIGEAMVREILPRMKFSNAVTEKVAKAVGAHMRLKGSGQNGELVSDKALRKFQVDMGEDLEMVLDVMDADNHSHKAEFCIPNQIAGIRERYKTLSVPKAKVVLPINGNDIMKTLGLAPGPEVGRLLKLVEEAWFADPSLTAEAAMNMVVGEVRSGYLVPSQTEQ